MSHYAPYMLHDHAVVTGAASGLGRALCLEVAGRGGKVVVSDVDMTGAEETAQLVEQRGGRAVVIQCDVADPDQMQSLSEKAEAEFGPVTLLCNNAGVAVSGPFEDISLKDWKWIMDINLWGVIHGCRAFLPAMRRRKHGYVLNVASAAGLLRMPEMSPYNVTKVGVVGLSETLNAEYASHHVKVTALCPTFFQTGILDNGRGNSAGTKLAARLMKRSKIQAPDVARIALEDLRKGRTYSIPMRDGRMMWRLKRAAPEAFYSLLAKGSRWMR